MKTIDCHNCGRSVNIEPESRTRDEKNAGHGRVMSPAKIATELQCACGKHL